jgi:prefoldin subunit 5
MLDLAGCSNYPAYAQNPEEELNILKEEANSVKRSLDMINRKIAELEKSSE